MTREEELNQKIEKIKEKSEKWHYVFGESIRDIILSIEAGLRNDKLYLGGFREVSYNSIMKKWIFGHSRIPTKNFYLHA